MTKQNYLDSIRKFGIGYVWQFTKQTVDIYKAYKSAEIFKEWFDSDRQLSIEDYFDAHAEEYEIKPNYRSLIIAQMLGFITKSSWSYYNEKVTTIFGILQKNEKNEDLFERIMSEQLLKFRIPDIAISRANNQVVDRNIYPIIFIFQVLFELKTKYNIHRVSIENLYLFIMTQNYHTDINQCVELLLDQSYLLTEEDYELVKGYAGRSRILTLLKNTQLFLIDSDNISLKNLNTRFYNKFLVSTKGKVLNSVLEYNELLTTFTNVNINIINIQEMQASVDNDLVRVLIDEEEIGIDDYQQKIEEQDDVMFEDTEEVAPRIATSTTERAQRNPKIGKHAIARANYECEIDSSHTTFISQSTNKQYMEAHHIIPMKFQDYFWEHKNKNIDSVNNVVSLCPNCHRMIHFGCDTDVKNIMEILFELRKEYFNQLNFNSVDELLDFLFKINSEK